MPCYHVLLLFYLLGCTWAVTTVTPNGVAPTKTYCPRFSPTFAVPTPTTQICAVAGTLSNPSLLNAYCGELIPGLGYFDTTFNTTCYRACAKDPKCLSYSVDPANIVCYTYGKTLAAQGFKADMRKYHFFTNIKTCYNCTSPAPPQQSACNDPAQPKSNPSSKYNCGTNGTIKSYFPAVYFGTLGLEAYPNACYDLCVEYFDPVGACEAYTLDGQTGICSIFDKPLNDVGFKPNRTGKVQGWNVRGCYECNAPTATIPTCQPTATPLNIGVRNGNFQGPTYSTNSPPKAAPTEWNIDYQLTNLYEFVQRPNGNKFVSLSSVIGRPAGIYGSLIEQNVYGLNDDPKSPNRFYNFSFDVAIPSYNVFKSNGSFPCHLLYPTITELEQGLRADSPKFQGTTLKTFGPYQVDASNISHYLPLRFVVTCYTYSNPYADANATYWVDNFRITQNGRDVGS